MAAFALNALICAFVAPPLALRGAVSAAKPAAIAAVKPTLYNERCARGAAAVRWSTSPLHGFIASSQGRSRRRYKRTVHLYPTSQPRSGSDRQNKHGSLLRRSSAELPGAGARAARRAGWRVDAPERGPALPRGAAAARWHHGWRCGELSSGLNSLRRRRVRPGPRGARRAQLPRGVSALSQSHLSAPVSVSRARESAASRAASTTAPK